MWHAAVNDVFEICVCVCVVMIRLAPKPFTELSVLIRKSDYSTVLQFKCVFHAILTSLNL